MNLENDSRWTGEVQQSIENVLRYEGLCPATKNETAGVFDRILRHFWTATF